MPRGWLGVQADGPLTEPGNPFASEWDLMAASGVETVRVAFDWREAQPAEGGPISFAATDAVVAAAAARRLPVLPVVHRTPDWAAARPGDGAAATPRGHGGLHGFLSALVGRYGPNGLAVGRAAGAAADADPRLADLERAEPHALLVARSRSREPYVRLLRASRRALRAADPGSRTILAGLPNESWIALRKVYKAGGRGAFDAVALHPYTGRPRNVIRLIEFARREMRALPRQAQAGVADGAVVAGVEGQDEGRARASSPTERGQASRLKLALTLLVAGAQAATDPAGRLVHVALPRGLAELVRLVGAAAGARRPAGDRAVARRVPGRGSATRALSRASISRAVRSQVNAAARCEAGGAQPLALGRVAEQRADGRRHLVGATSRPPRPRSPRARCCRRRRRACRTPSPRARAGRSPRRGSGSANASAPAYSPGSSSSGTAPRWRSSSSPASRANCGRWPPATTTSISRAPRAGRAPAGSCARSGRRRRGRRAA